MLFFTYLFACVYSAWALIFSVVVRLVLTAVSLLLLSWILSSFSVEIHSFWHVEINASMVLSRLSYTEASTYYNRYCETRSLLLTSPSGPPHCLNITCICSNFCSGFQEKHRPCDLRRNSALTVRCHNSSEWRSSNSHSWNCLNCSLWLALFCSWETGLLKE